MSTLYEHLFDDAPGRWVSLLGFRHLGGGRINELRGCMNFPSRPKWVVGAVGRGYFDATGLHSIPDLPTMPSFPYDDPSFEFRSLDLLLLLFSDSTASLDDATSRFRACPSWNLVFEGKGERPSDARNALGFRENVSNLGHPDERADFEQAVFTSQGGTFLVYRRIEFDLARWATFSSGEQARIVGVHPDGRPLGDRDSLGRPSYRFDPDGVQTPVSSHVRRAYPRRPIDPVTLEADSSHRVVRRACNDRERPGLHFLCYQKDILRGFEYVYTRFMLNKDFPAPGAGPDRLIAEQVARTTAGGYFFVPPDAALYESAAVATWMKDYD